MGALQLATNQHPSGGAGTLRTPRPRKIGRMHPNCPEGPVGIAENKQVVLDFYDAAARGDMDGCFALLADDITWVNIGTTKFSGTYRGKEALVGQLLGPLFAQLKAGISTRIERLVAESDVVVAQTAGTAETHDGIPYNNSYCQVMRIRDGKIAEVKEYFDTQLASEVFDSA